MEKVAKRMQELFSYLSSIENINRGGCLFAALAVYKVLKKEGLNNPDVVLVQVHSTEDLINYNEQFISGESSQVFSSNHFVLSPDLGRTLYDSGGMYNPFDDGNYYSLIIPNDTIEDFCESALLKANWNKKFKRTRGVKEINFMLGTKIPNYRKNFLQKICGNKK